MLKPKPRAAQRYWETLSDAQLLGAELTTDDPEGLGGLVEKLPSGEGEPYVEYKYDLRGQEREPFRCIHGNHPHLAGFVMRKGEARFLVGHICGSHIYGEDFEAYTADFNAAVNRRDTLRRRREIEEATTRFLRWVEGVNASQVFAYYQSVCDQMDERLPWIYDNLLRAAAIAGPQAGVRFPPTLFGAHADPQAHFGKATAEFSAAAANLAAMSDQAVNMEPVRRRFESLLRRIEAALDEVKEVEDFFQPAALDAICALANAYDNPKKRRYVAGMMSIACRRKKDEVAVRMPKNFRLPERGAIDAFRKALGGIAL